MKCMPKKNCIFVLHFVLDTDVMNIILIFTNDF